MVNSLTQSLVNSGENVARIEIHDVSMQGRNYSVNWGGGYIRAVTKALIGGGGGWIFIYSRSARRISFEISCHYS